MGCARGGSSRAHRPGETRHAVLGAAYAFLFATCLFGYSLFAKVRSPRARPRRHGGAARMRPVGGAGCLLRVCRRRQGLERIDLNSRNGLPNNRRRLDIREVQDTSPCQPESDIYSDGCAVRNNGPAR